MMAKQEGTGFDEQLCPVDRSIGVLDPRTTETICPRCGTVINGPEFVCASNDEHARLMPNLDPRTWDEWNRVTSSLDLPPDLTRIIVRLISKASEAGLTGHGGEQPVEAQVGAAALIVLRSHPRFQAIATMNRVLDALGAPREGPHARGIRKETRKLMFREIRAGKSIGIDPKLIRCPEELSVADFARTDPVARSAIDSLLTGVERERLNRWLENPSVGRMVAKSGATLQATASYLAVLAIQASDEVAPGRKRIGVERAAEAFHTTEPTVRRAMVIIGEERTA